MFSLSHHCNAILPSPILPCVVFEFKHLDYISAKKYIFFYLRYIDLFEMARTFFLLLFVAALRHVEWCHLLYICMHRQTSKQRRTEKNRRNNADMQIYGFVVMMIHERNSKYMIIISEFHSVRFVLNKLRASYIAFD